MFFYFLYFASFLEPCLANSDSLNSKNFADFSQYWEWARKVLDLLPMEFLISNSDVNIGTDIDKICHTLNILSEPFASWQRNIIALMPGFLLSK